MNEKQHTILYYIPSIKHAVDNNILLSFYYAIQKSYIVYIKKNVFYITYLISLLVKNTCES